MASQMQRASKVFLKSLTILAGALLMMGNQKCEQQPQVRELRKIVELGAIKSNPVIFPNGGVFDFQFVANQQIYGVLFGSKKFALKYNPPIAMPPQEARNADIGFFNLTKADASKMKTFAQAVGKDNYDIQYAKTAWCMVNLPQAKIKGSINSFELIGGGGVTVGFTSAGALSPNGLSQVGFNVEWSQLDVSLAAIRPLTSNVMAATNLTSKQTKTKVNFSLTYGMFSIGPSAYYQTPLAQVTKSALEKSITAISDQLKKDEWYTRVLANHDTHLVVVGGTDVNLEVGDQLLVYNEDYYWEGEPCDSRYLGGGAKTNSAVAKIEIDWVGDEISRGHIIEQTDENAVVGAKVKLFKFHDPNFKAQDAGVQSATPSTGSDASATSKPGRG